METLLISLGTAVGMLFTVYNMFGFRWIAENPNKTDVGCMIITLLFFSSTSTQGIFVSILSGLFVSIMTKIICAIWGTKKGAREDRAPTSSPALAMLKVFGKKAQAFVSEPSHHERSTAVAEQLTPAQRAHNRVATRSAIESVEEMIRTGREARKAH